MPSPGTRPVRPWAVRPRSTRLAVRQMSMGPWAKVAAARSFRPLWSPRADSMPTSTVTTALSAAAHPCSNTFSSDSTAR